MILTSNFIDNFFDDAFLIRKINEIKNLSEVTHDDDEQ